MKEALATEYVESDEIELRELFGILWRGKWLIVGGALMAVVISVAITLTIPNIYKSEALLAPADDSSGGGLAALAGQLGGLASLAGVNLGKTETNKITIGLEVLKSRSFIADFIKRRNIWVPLLASKGWNAVSGEVAIDEDVYDVESERWVNPEKYVNGVNPGEWVAYNAFSSLLNVTQAKDTGLIKISITHHSPVIARQWVEWLVEDVNKQMRQRDIDEATRSIEYLKQQLDKTPVTGMQQIFYQLIEKQMQTIMLANVRDQYVFKIIDPPVVPEEKAGPKRALIALLSLVLAVVFSSLVVLVIGGSGKEKPQQLQ